MNPRIPGTPSHTSRTSARVWLAGCIALALVACASAPPPPPPPKVEVIQRASSLPGARYAWVAEPAQLDAEADPRVTDPAFRQRLQGALDKALQAKGYRLAVAGETPDFLAAYRVGVRDLEQTLVKDPGEPAFTPETTMVCSAAAGCSQLVTRGPDGVPVAKLSTTRYTQGGLLVEILRPGELNVLWSAIDKGTVHRGDAAQPRLDEFARQTLAQLPAAGTP